MAEIFQNQETNYQHVGKCMYFDVSQKLWNVLYWVYSVAACGWALICYFSSPDGTAGDVCFAIPLG